MTKLSDAAAEFLAQEKIAVAGVSRDKKQPANLIYRRLRDSGHEVFAVNPNTDEVEGGDPCYPTVQAVPAQLDGLVVVTTPEVAEQVVADAHAAGVPRVWLHRGIGEGSSSQAAVEYCTEHGISVIPGGCPCMFGEMSDPGHRGMRVVLQLSGKIPREV